MESLLLSPKFTPTPRLLPAPHPPFSPAPPRLRHRHLRLCLPPGGGSDATEDEATATTTKDDDLGTLVRKVFDAYRNSDNDLLTFHQNLVDAGLADESEAALAFADGDLSPIDLGVLWKLPALALFSFAGVPALLGYLGDAAGVDRFPAWIPPRVPARGRRVGRRRGAGGAGRPRRGGRPPVPRVGGGAAADDVAGAVRGARGHRGGRGGAARGRRGGWDRRPRPAAAALDFSVSRVFPPGGGRVSISVGTTTYMSPKRFAPNAQTGPRGACAADVWSSGLTVLPAEERPSWKMLKEAICEGEAPSVPENAASSAELRGFVAACLQKEPMRRAMVAQLLAHPFVARRDV